MACAAMPASESSPNYELLGKGVASHGMQTLEFYIRTDGMVVEHVTGVRGHLCEKVC